MDLSKNTKEFITWLVVFSCFMFAGGEYKELAPDAPLSARIIEGVAIILHIGCVVFSFIQLNKAIKN